MRSPAELASPGGLTSPGWSKTQAAEIACWQAATRGLWAEMRAGRYIMVMVFVRTGVAKWDEASKNFAFDPKMDALLAAYSVAPSVGQPYKPGTCLEMFVKSTVAASAMGAAASEARARRVSDAVYLAFQMPEDTSPIHFQQVGVVGMLKSLEKGGQPFVEASINTANSFIRKEKFGWKGGVFPELLNCPPGRG